MKAADPNFKGDKIANSLAADKPLDVVAVSGYLGPIMAHNKGGAKSRRLFADLRLRSYLVIGVDDITDHVSADKHEAEGRTIVWIKRDASVVRCTALPAADLETAAAPDFAVDYQRIEEDLGSYRVPRP